MPVNPKISVTPIPIRMITLAIERLFTSSWTKVTMTSFLGALASLSLPSQRRRDPPTERSRFLSAEESTTLPLSAFRARQLRQTPAQLRETLRLSRLDRPAEDSPVVARPRI